MCSSEAQLVWWYLPVCGAGFSAKLFRNPLSPCSGRGQSCGAALNLQSDGLSVRPVAADTDRPVAPDTDGDAWTAFRREAGLELRKECREQNWLP